MINTSKRGKTGAATGGGEHWRGVLEVSERKHLTSREVERLIQATKGKRNEVRDSPAQVEHAGVPKVVCLPPMLL